MIPNCCDGLGALNGLILRLAWTFLNTLEVQPGFVVGIWPLSAPFYGASYSRFSSQLFALTPTCLPFSLSFMQLMRVGRNIGTIQVEIFDAATGKLCAQGVHVKFVSETDMDLTPLANLLPGPPSLPEPRLESTARTAAPRSKL